MIHRQLFCFPTAIAVSEQVREYDTTNEYRLLYWCSLPIINKQYNDFRTAGNGVPGSIWKDQKPYGMKTSCSHRWIRCRIRWGVLYRFAEKAAGISGKIPTSFLLWASGILAVSACFGGRMQALWAINIVYCDLCLWAVACMCSFVYGKKRS